MRTPKPWYRKQTDSWYVEVGGKQIPLARGKANRQAAVDAFYQLMATKEPPAERDLTVAELCDLFLQWSKLRHAEETFRWHKRFLQEFCTLHGRRKASEIVPYHVTQWLDNNRCGNGKRRHASYVVKRAFSWAFKEGLLSKHALAPIKIEKSGTRERVLSPEERKKILDAIPDQPFKDVVIALQETGCRPSEIARVTAADVDLQLGIWVFKKHKTAKQTRKPRVVYLTPTMVEISRRLMAANPEGELFRTFRGKKPWKRNAIRLRFKRLREKLPELGNFISYNYRHTYCTDALMNGVGVAQVAELLGHTSTDMVMRHYSKLSQKVDHLRDAALKAISEKS
jgi:integrase